MCADDVSDSVAGALEDLRPMTLTLMWRKALLMSILKICASLPNFFSSCVIWSIAGKVNSVFKYEFLSITAFKEYSLGKDKSMITLLLSEPCHKWGVMTIVNRT